MYEIIEIILTILGTTSLGQTKTYYDSICYGVDILSLPESGNGIDWIDTQQRLDDVILKVTSTLDTPQFISSAIASTETIYVIFKIATDNEYYIGILDLWYTSDTISNFINSITNSVKISDPNFYISGMTFDTAGNLWIIDFETKQICTLNPSTGYIIHTSGPVCLDGGGQACDPSHHCNEVISYNWENDLLYRISSHSSGLFESKLYIQDLTSGVVIEYDIIDPNNLCHFAITALEYIGNDMFLISCSSLILQMDTTHVTTPTIQSFNNGWVNGGLKIQSGRSGVGIISFKLIYDTSEYGPYVYCSGPTLGPTVQSWQTANTIISDPIGGVCGYNNELSMVYMAGISDAISYDVSSDNIIQQIQGPESLILNGAGQHYVSTKTSDILYLQNYQIGRLVGIGSTAPSVIFPAFPTQGGVEGGRACLAISEDNNYLFVLGGSYTGTASNKVSLFVVYDIINNEWFRGASMNIKRANMACIADNNYLYVFGGDGIDSIEKIEISLIENIKYTFTTWTMLSSTLSQGKNAINAVKFNGYIYIIGGNTNSGVVADVDRFDTSNDMIYTDTSLPIPLRTYCIAATDDKLYIFGGTTTNNGIVNTIYYTEAIDPCNSINCEANERCINGKCEIDCNGN